MKRLASVLLALLALGVPLAGCGGGDDPGDDGGGSATTPTALEADGDGAGRGNGEAESRDQEEGEDADGSAGGAAPTPKDRAATAPGGVDLTVDPGSIRGARVTATGAVQTLPPNAKAQETAQENGYSSINNFGQEAAGEEATHITFALVQYLTARVEGDWPTACARLYGVLRENLESSAGGRACPEVYGELMSRVSKASLEEQARIDVSSVRHGEGNRAFVIYKTPDTLSADMPMYVEGGVWKVGALEAYVLRPGQAG